MSPSRKTSPGPSARRASARAPAARPRWPGPACAAVVVLATLAAYVSSFQGAMVFDDDSAIIANPSIRHLWPPGPVLHPPGFGTPVQGRPVINLTLAVNYALGGLDPWGYHAVNLLVHILAALTLLGIVRRTLLSDPLRARFGAAAWPLATATALIWALHPIQTESVTYLCQRAESIMGLFFLLTLYCAIRAAASPRPALWSVAAVASCLLGMGSKEVMVGAPLLVLLYDRTFLAGSFGEALRRRWKLYAALAATWLLLGGLLIGSGSRGGTAGLGGKVTSLQYACTQFGAIVEYLRQSFWPNAVVFDYGYFLAHGAAQIVPYAIIVGLLVGGTALALVRWPAWGFLGAWFFVILAPTSSVVPVVTQSMAEHRMYLPLAALAATVVLGAFLLGERLVRGVAKGPRARGREGWGLGAVAAVVATAIVAAALGYLTFQRNYDYRSLLAIWDDTVNKRPDNVRALGNRGALYVRMGRQLEALHDLDKAIELDPDYADAYPSRGEAYARLGQYDQAFRDFNKAIALNEDLMEAYLNRGAAYGNQGRSEEAIRDFEKVLKIDGNHPRAWFDRGGVYYNMGRYEEAIRDFNRAIELDGELVDAYVTRARARVKLGQNQEAVRDCSRAIELSPERADAYRCRAEARVAKKDYEGAWADVRSARKLGLVPDPDFIRLLTAATGHAE